MGLSNCWLCQGAGAETKLSVDREKFGGIKGNTRVVYVHLVLSVAMVYVRSKIKYQVAYNVTTEQYDSIT